MIAYNYSLFVIFFQLYIDAKESSITEVELVSFGYFKETNWYQLCLCQYSRQFSRCVV